MKLSDQAALRRVLLPATLFCAAIAPAQDALMSLPATSLPAPVLRDSGPPSQSRPNDPTGAFFQFGSISFHPHILARYGYGMGLPTRGGRHVASEIYTTAPGLRLDAGQHWTLDYTPTWTNYTARALEDTFDQSIRLNGAGMLQEWAVNFSEDYRISNPLLYETGQQTEQRTWATVLGASHKFGTGLAFQTTASLNERYGETFPDTRDWATMNWLTKQLSTHADAGLGFGAGYNDIVGEPDATNERYMGRFNWHPTEKLSLNLDGGIEARHSRASNANDMNNPIIDASIEWQPYDVTTLALSRSRSVSTSYYQNQVVVGSNWNLSLNQRLLGHYFLSASYTHATSDYDSTTTDVPAPAPADPLADPVASTTPISLPGRSDETDSFNVRLTTQLFQHWSVTASYQRNNNKSNQKGYTFDTRQYGLEVSLRY